MKSDKAVSVDLYGELMKDIRFVEGFHACINCGVCTAICPAAEFYKYDPRQIVNIVQTKDAAQIEELLKSDMIWYCAECLSCKTRCPKNNCPGYVIQALRFLSHKTGYFVESEKGRQSLALKRTVGDNVLKYGYCVYADEIDLGNHPEQGPVWDWLRKNTAGVYERLGANYKGEGPGILRKTSDEALAELKQIFDVTGGTELFDTIEKYSRRKAREMSKDFDRTTSCEYYHHVNSQDNGQHTGED